MNTDEMAGRLFDATVGALELLSVHIGWRLGLYRVLDREGPLTSGELSGTAAIDERYAREWLEQQAVAGFLEVENAADPDRRRFRLPPEHAAVLADPESPAHVAPFGAMVAGIGAALPAVIEAYRTGGGVPYPLFGADFRDGQGAINRPAFTHEMDAWLRAIPGMAARLEADPPARVADLGCGQGWSTLAIARAFPNARVEGIDSDEASVLEAEQRVADPGVGGHLSFGVRDATDLAATGPYDLVCIFEALHDMSRPVEALEAARRALSPDGTVLVVDERVADSFADAVVNGQADPVERAMYGWSVVHCLPASRADSPSAALGTALRASTVSELATAAGFSRVDQVPIENDFFRFYQLHP